MIPRILLDEGACSGKPFEWFWPVNELGEDMNRYVTPEAEGVCDSCRVLTVCRDYARRSEPFGIWGGESPAQREQWRRDNPKEGTEWTHRG